MSLELIIGPMFSGKSTELLRRIRRYEISGYNILKVGYMHDWRSKSCIKTHDDISTDIILIDKLSKVFDLSDYVLYDIIVFDEAQFFPDLCDTIKLILHSNKKVICAGLSGSYKREPFLNMSNIISYATDITHLKAICTYHQNLNEKCCGEEAPYTCKIKGQLNDNIEIGDNDMYVPRCYKHFNK